MSQSSSLPVPLPAGPDDLRLVLFGLPAAGKSSLLGALGQAAQTQTHILGGSLKDSSHRLAELTRQVYDETTRRTVEEIVAYPVRFQPTGQGGEAVRQPVDLVLLDCDGQVVNDLLLRRNALNEASPEGTLAHEITRADTIILVIDAAAPEAEVQADFVAFGKFLKALQRTRGARTEVAGLPVFLVLTKVDLLAQPGDSMASWVDRIEERKRHVDEHFRAYLASAAEEANAPPPQTITEKPAELMPGADTTTTLPAVRTIALPFGRIDLHIWATAVKRPALANTPARPREPYGVAELFRQCLDEAEGYRHACRRARRRLVGLVTAVSLLVLMLLGGTSVLVLSALDIGVSQLQAKVEDYRYTYRGEPAERLGGWPDDLRKKQLQPLEEIASDPLFKRLPTETQAFVERRIEELKAYIAYLEKLLALPPLGSELRESALDRTIARLRDELALPRSEWADTFAGQLHRQRLASAEALDRAVRSVSNWFLNAIDQANSRFNFERYRNPATGISWADWAGDVEKLLAQKARLPFRETEPVPGVVSPPLTYATVFRFDRVTENRTEWELARNRLIRALNITSALGLAPPTKERPAVLAIPGNITSAETRTHLEQLKTAYPDYEKQFVLAGLPDEVVAALRPTARRQYRQLLEPARAEVLRQLRLARRGTEETPKRWEMVLTWLKQPDTLSAWRDLAGVLLRLHEPKAEDPVRALVNFLARTQFFIEVKTLRLSIPEVRGLRPRAETPLVILHPASDRQPALAFEPSGEPQRDPVRRALVYTYRLARGQRIVYRPGDRMWGLLALSGGKEQLVWSQSRSGLYQFERLHNPPRLQSINATSLEEGRLLDDVELTVEPEEGLPAVPDLMPWVKLGE